MRPWSLKVHCRHGRNKVTEVTLNGIDPDTSVSAVVVELIEREFLQQFNDMERPLKNDSNAKRRYKERRAEMYEEYGLFLPNQNRMKKADEDGVDQNGTYLEGTKPLAYYSLNRKKETIELRLKPKHVKVKFVDNTFQQIKLTPYSLIGEIIKRLCNMV